MYTYVQGAQREAPRQATRRHAGKEVSQTPSPCTPVTAVSQTEVVHTPCVRDRGVANTVCWRQQCLKHHIRVTEVSCSWCESRHTDLVVVGGRVNLAGVAECLWYKYMNVSATSTHICYAYTCCERACQPCPRR